MEEDEKEKMSPWQDKQTNQQRGKIGRLGQWMLEGWDEQNETDQESSLRPGAIIPRDSVWILCWESAYNKSLAIKKRTKLVRHAVKQAKRTSDRKIVDSKYSSNFVGHSSFLLSITSLSTFFRVKDHVNIYFRQALMLNLQRKPPRANTAVLFNIFQTNVQFFFFKIGIKNLKGRFV